jgi:hypothetical protein
MADLEERKRGTEAQQDFKNAGNANVIRQAGEGLDAASNATPTPGTRLTTSQVRAEAGRRPDQGNPATSSDAGRQVDAAAKAEEREALRRQGQQETDSDLEPNTRPEGSTALIDPVITSNPD